MLGSQEVGGAICKPGWGESSQAELVVGWKWHGEQPEELVLPPVARRSQCRCLRAEDAATPRLGWDCPCRDFWDTGTLLGFVLWILGG